MWRVRHILLGFVAAGMVAAALQNARGQVSVEIQLQPRIVAVGEPAQLAIVVRGARRPTPPNLPHRVDGLQIAFEGEQQKISISGSERDVAQIYHYRVVAERAGDYQIGPFPYRVDGQNVEIPAVSLQVVAAERRGGVTDLSEVLWAELRTERTSPFVDEAFDMELVLGFRDVNLAPELSLQGLPESGLQFGRWEELAGGREVRDGRIYEVRRFRTRVRPTAAGRYRLEPGLRVNLLVERQGRRRSLLDDFFSDFPGFPDMPFTRAVRQPLDLPVKPLEIVVRPLPSEGRPATFSGAVGRFGFDVAVSPTRAAVGSPITVRMTIEGEGNIDMVAAPSWEPGDKFRAYEVRLAETATLRGGRGGRRVYEQVLIPRDESAREIPAIEFSYFDTAAEAYRTIRRGPFPLELLPGEATGGAIVAAAEPRERVRVGESDIVYLKAAPRRWRRADDARGWRSPWARAWPWIPPLAVAVAGWVELRRARYRNHPELVRRRDATAVAREGLQRAAVALRAGERAAFYDAVWRTLVDYFARRLDLPPGGVHADVVIARASKAASADWQAAVRDLFAACESARYGGAAPPGSDGEAELRAAYERLKFVLRHAEKWKLS